VSDGVIYDFGEVNTLAADLIEEASPATTHRVRQAVERTAFKMRTDWRDLAKDADGKHAKGYPFSIDYDLELLTDGQISAQIGPNRDRGRQAELDVILEDAHGKIKSKPQHNGDKALRNNLLDYETGINIAIGPIL
jgi:hypothetical protein